MFWTLNLWPGLTVLLRRGSYTALACAIAYGALLSSAVMASLVWPDALGGTSERLLWIAVAIASLGSLLFADNADRSSSQGSGASDSFEEATELYLRGEWYEAEHVARTTLGRSPRDVEMRLLLATLLRHTKRYDEASEQLDWLSRLDESLPWAFEIAAERRWIREDASDPIDDEDSTDESEDDATAEDRTEEPVEVESSGRRDAHGSAA